MTSGSTTALPSKVIGRIRHYARRVTDLTPDALQPGGPTGKALRLLEGVLILAVLDLNGLVARRATPDRKGWWDPGEFDWIADLEAKWLDIRSEIEDYLRSHSAPRTIDLIGTTEEPTETITAVPDGTGSWRAVILQSFGDPIARYTAHFPLTMDAIATVPAQANVGFSCLDPRSGIDTHTDPNFGSLRVQLPVIVPGRPGDCCLQVGEEVVVLEEGRAVVFDLTEPHSARNDSDGIRVLLTMEVLMPMSFFPSLLNRAAQWAYGRLPSFRGLVDRADVLAATARTDLGSEVDRTK